MFLNGTGNCAWKQIFRDTQMYTHQAGANDQIFSGGKHTEKQSVISAHAESLDM